MPKRTPLRPLSKDELQRLTQISRSRRESVRRVERAKTILALNTGLSAEAVACQQGISRATVDNRRRRFNADGLGVLDDLPRQGRPFSYDEHQRGQIVLTAKTHPQQVGLEVGHWTLTTLVVYVNEQLHIPISRSQLAEVLKQEGLRWYQEKTYFSESPDPQFVEKRGPL
jgi:transposase